MKKHKIELVFYVLSVVFLLAFIIIISIDSKLDSESKYSFLFKCLEYVFPISSVVSSGVSLKLSVNINTGISDSSNGKKVNVVNNFNGVEGLNKIVKTIVNYIENTSVKSEENKEEKTSKSNTKNNEVSLKGYSTKNPMISYKETRQIWAKLLGQKYIFLGKRTRKGYISQKAFNILLNKSTIDIELMSMVLRATFSTGEICYNISKELTKEELLRLYNWGLIENEVFSESFSIRPESEATIICGKLALVVKNKSLQSPQCISWDCYMLTKEGRELQKALNSQISFKSAFEFCQDIVDQNNSKQCLEFSAFDILKIKTDSETGSEYPICGKHNYLS